MATIQTIGTASRDFSTLQAWEDAMPATPTGGYEGHCYNDSQFTGRLDISGHTTSSTNYIKLTAAAGQSFQDHANKRTNPLFYDQSKGVGIAANPGSAGSVIDVDNDFVTIERLQIKRTGASYSHTVVNFVSNNMTNNVIRECILEKAFSANVPVLQLRNGKAINCLIVNSGATVGLGIDMYKSYSTPAQVLNCTIVNVAAAGGSAFGTGGGGDDDNDITNCAVFGYSSIVSSGTPVGNRNATNLASGLPGANSIHSLTASNQFVNAANDFRLKVGSALIDAGNTDATNAPNDITGLTRGSGTTGDIGAWEDSGSTFPGNASGDVVSVTVSAPAGSASSARSITVTLRSNSGALLNTVARRFWTRSNLQDAAADGGAGGLSVTCNGSGVFALTGLTVLAGAGWLTYKDPSDDLNCHIVPVTFA